jgi:tRNA A37 threonylcarbamoyltransferase TsaD
LRKQLAVACEKNGLQLRLAPANLCTDNAAMIGILAEQKLNAGENPAPIETGIMPAKGL